ncbi:MAG: M20/M25/M40 family metallo-hydrolase, partial [Planctomycetota bacterium]
MSTPELPQPLPGPAAGLEFPPHPPVRVKPQASAEPTQREKPAIRAAEARWLDVARLLLLEPTSPFHEQNILHRVTHVAEAAALTAERDAHGNLMIDLPTSGESHQIPLLLTAHADHPGFWAEGMVDRNTLSAHWIGRVPRGYFLGAAVRFVTADAGSTGSGSFPLGGKAVRGRITRVSEYRGEGDYARVEIETDAEVAPGSTGQWDLPPCELIDGQIHATAIDDVAGVAALVCVMQELALRGASRPVRLLITRAEEAGFVGCVGYCRDQANAGQAGQAQIVGIEMSKAMPEAPVGSGPIVRVGDRRSVFDAATTADVARAAERLAQSDPDFTYQRRLMPGGTCESSV